MARVTRCSSRLAKELKMVFDGSIIVKVAITWLDQYQRSRLLVH